MRSMRRRVLEHDVAHWATTFLDALDQPKQQRPPETGEAELAGASSRRRMRFEG
jgi:trehalose-6-phosphate synthase